MKRLTFFTKNCCSLCDSAKFVVTKVRQRIDFSYEEIDIGAKGNESWYEKYKNDIPVIHIDRKEVFTHRVVEKELVDALQRL